MVDTVAPCFYLELLFERSQLARGVSASLRCLDVKGFQQYCITSMMCWRWLRPPLCSRISLVQVTNMRFHETRPCSLKNQVGHVVTAAVTACVRATT